MPAQQYPVRRESFILSVPSGLPTELDKLLRDVVTTLERLQEDLDTIVGRRGLPKHYNILDMNGNPITNAGDITGGAGIFSGALTAPSATFTGNVAAGIVNVSGHYAVAGTQVVTSRQGAIPDVAIAGAVNPDDTARAKINSILAMIRIHGLIAP